jgi:iron(III) transport system substrate-binding protein
MWCSARRRRVRRATLTAGATVLITGVIAACSSSSSGGTPSPGATAGSSSGGASSLVQQAKAEGNLTLLSSLVTTQLARLASGFQSEYGIKVSYESVPSSPLETKISGEESSGRFTEDVIGLSDQSVLTALNGKGDLADLTSLSNYAAFPAADKNSYSMVGSILPAGIVYNTADVKTKISSWQDAINAAYKGKIVTLDPSTSPVAVSIYTMLSKSFGSSYLTQLAALNPTFVASSSLLVQQVASGQADVGLLVTLSAVPPVKNTGAPIAWVLPGPTSGPLQYFGAVKNGPDPAAARLFMDYLLSSQGQAAVNGGGLAASPLSGVPGVIQVPADFQVPNTSLPATQVAAIKSALKVTG